MEIVPRKLNIEIKTTCRSCFFVLVKSGDKDTEAQRIEQAIIDAIGESIPDAKFHFFIDNE